MFTIEMVPAGHGDCLWIEYGSENAPHRVLIDGGTAGTYDRLKKRIGLVPGGAAGFELLVVTHVDGDHIAGVLKLFEDQTSGASFNDVWFNGYRHLPTTGLEALGPVQGESLTERIVTGHLNWNNSFDSKAAALSGPDALPEKTLPGGMKLTLLSPTLDDLSKLKPVWKAVVIAAGLDPEATYEEKEDEDTRPSGLEKLGGVKLPDIEALAATPFEEDTSEANGSSIVLLAEYHGHSILLCGDAHPEDVAASLEKLAAERGVDAIALDAVKLPHHGSKANVSAELLGKVNCQAYLISTNGAYFEHPDDVAMARVIKYGGPNPGLYFNYLSKYNQIWANTSLQKDNGYSASYPAASGEGMVVRLE